MRCFVVAVGGFDYDENWVANKYGIKPEYIVILHLAYRKFYNDSHLKPGVRQDLQLYNDLHNFVVTHDLNVLDNYKHIENTIDLDSLIDCYLSFMYLGNTDWPQHVKMW